MLRPIRTKKQYRQSLARVYDLMQRDPKAGSALGDELDVLSLLVEDYEQKHFPIPPPHPIEAIRFRLEQMEWQTADLQPILGSKSRVSEILNGKRKLSLEMIRKLHEALKIPLETLVARY